MARIFDGIAGGLNVTLDLSSFNQAAVSFWMWQNVNGSNFNMAWEGGINTPAFVAGGFYIIQSAGGGTAQVAVSRQGASTTDKTFTSPSTNTWHHWLINLDFSVSGAGQIPSVYIDGISQTLTTGTTASTAGNFSSLTHYFMYRGNGSLLNAGKTADRAIWAGQLLSGNEALALARGARPNQLRTQPFFWSPIDGLIAPEPDMSGNKNNVALLTGPTFTTGPSIGLFTRPRGPTPLIQVGGVVPWPLWQRMVA